jgi:glutamine amidotransferase/cyclase
MFKDRRVSSINLTSILCLTSCFFGAELVADIKSAVSIPVIASSGAGKPEHFSACLAQAKPDAVLAAGIFHRQEVPIGAVKEHLREQGYTVRL